MNPALVIRNETHEDVCAISWVTIAAFKALEIGNNTEQFIIVALRAANALTVSLVAEMDGQVIRHIAFSPATISDGTPNWYGLGSVSVLPEYQRKGIDSPDERRAVLPERYECSRLLSRGTPGLLHEIQVQKPTGAGA